MELPIVAKCEGEDCAHNIDYKCHASVVNIGDGECPRCNNYISIPEKTGLFNLRGRVTACDIIMCAYNSRFECRALDICVGCKKNDILCLTCQP